MITGAGITRTRDPPVFSIIIVAQNFLVPAFFAQKLIIKS